MVPYFYSLVVAFSMKFNTKMQYFLALRSQFWVQFNIVLSSPAIFYEFMILDQ